MQNQGCIPDQPPLGKPTALYGNLLRCKAIAKAASGTIQLRSPLQASLATSSAATCSGEGGIAACLMTNQKYEGIAP